MSVLIRGLEMPGTCSSCKLIRYMGGGTFFCPVTGTNMDIGTISKIARLENCPVAEQKSGKWIWDDEGFHCSECFYHAYGNTLEVMDGAYRFCPNCGAQMDGDSDV